MHMMDFIIGGRMQVRNVGLQIFLEVLRVVLASRARTSLNAHIRLFDLRSRKRILAEVTNGLQVVRFSALSQIHDELGLVDLLIAQSLKTIRLCWCRFFDLGKSLGAGG